MPEQLVRYLSDVQLRNLMRDLLVAEAYRSSADISKVIVNAELKASDDGSDALTPPGATSHGWLSDVETCWQLKAGNASQASKLKGEITKPIAARTLKGGGRFVLVASGAGDGPRGITARKKALVEDAKRARLPRTRIEVLTSEALTTWINEHPAIAAELRGMPRGFCSLKDWANYPVYRDPWVSSSALDAKLDQVRQAVAFENTNEVVHHLHVFGRPGIGKTRFVLQACHDARWSKSVLYVPQWAEADIAGLLAAVAQAGAGRLVLVVDEVPPEQVKSLAFHAFAGVDRIRVITIGHHESPDGGTIAQIEVEALDDLTMATLIEAAHPTMPSEHIRYVVSFADGYTRLARLAANAVAAHPDIHTADLLYRGDIKQLMDSMLGDEDRQPLHVLAILSSVGWTGPRADEGQAIAAHFEQDWLKVQASVQRFHVRFGIAPRANDLRYISPAPLGVYLALDAIQSYPERVRTLPDKLPNDQARYAYNERIAAILANPWAKAFGEEELTRFFHWSHFLDATAVDRWVTLSVANPVLAAGKAREALQQASDDERRQIVGGARRGLVRGLARLASYSDAFHDAALALAELAAAENETWANNASTEFVARYQLFLGGTACPYLDRLAVLDELLASERPRLQGLAIRALARAGSRQDRHRVDSSTAPGPMPAQWRPTTVQESLECALAAFRRLERAAALSVPGQALDQALIDAAKQLAILLREEPVREVIAAFFRTVAAKHPSIREHLRREIHGIAQRSQQFWKDRDDVDIVWIESLEKEFSDRTLGGRLREMVGPPDWERTEESLRPLAEELITTPDVLWSEWSWLTGGDAAGAWDLGGALENADSRHELLSQFIAAAGTGPDLRMIAGYVRSRAKTMPEGWLDDWLDEIENSSESMPLLVFDLTWRLTATSRGARRLTRMARANLLTPNFVANLAFGPWVLDPEMSALRELIEALIVTPGNRIHLLHMVDNRVQKHPQDIQGVEDLALKLVCDPDLLLGDSMEEYHWNKLARALLPSHARAIARTIFAAQARPNGASFFLEHSSASATLDACVDADAEAVWEELAPHLTDDHQNAQFVIGFPHHILGAVPRQPVLDWITVDPAKRAALVAAITATNFADTSLAAAILDRWGGINDVKQRFFSAFVTGGWSGEASAHWEQLAVYLEGIGKQTKLNGVRRWALDSVRVLRRMAEDDHRREAEERVRGYG